MRYLLILIISLTVFFISGCSYTGVYNPAYIKGNINNSLIKEKQIDVAIKESNVKISKHPISRKGRKTTLFLNIGNINTQVTKEFFAQYFKDVKISKEKTSKGLFIDSSITDFKYAYGEGFSDDCKIWFTLNLKVYFNDKKILDKSYNEFYNNNVLLTEHSLTLFYEPVEAFHKGLIEVYSKQVVPDLVEALKKALNNNK